MWDGTDRRRELVILANARISAAMLRGGHKTPAAAVREHHRGKPMVSLRDLLSFVVILAERQNPF
jgi:hypothetical protein